MAHIVCITTGLSGVLHASFEVVSRLQAAGHRVTYACPQDVRELVNAQGLDFTQLTGIVFDPDPGPPPVAGTLARIRQGWTQMRTLPERRRAAIEALGMADFAETLRGISPDFLLIDMELHDHIITAVSLNLPLALLDQFFSSWRRPGLPPIQSRIIPGRGRRGRRWAIALVWLKQSAKHWVQIHRQTLRCGFTDRRAILRAYARSVGFPLKLLEQYNWPQPFTYRKLPVLSMTCAGLDFSHDRRPNFHYVGPMVATNRVDLKADSEVSDALEKLFAARIRSGQSLIHCGISSMERTDVRFLRRLIEAVTDREDWLMVVALGGRFDRDALGLLPKNIQAFSWIPQLRVLAQADCSIHHGGIHTINECLHYRVPMLVYSGGKHDQNGNAARVTHHGVGLIGDRAGDDAQMIQRRIERVLGDASIRSKIDEISSFNKAAAQKDRLVRLVEDCLERSRPLMK